MKEIPKKIVLIICPFFSPNIGGVERHLDTLCSTLVKNGNYVYVQTYRPLNVKANYLAKETKPGITIYRHWIPGTGLYEKLGFFQVLQAVYTVPLLLFHTLSFMFKHGRKIDIINSHGLNGSIVAFVLKIFFSKKKFTATTHYIYRIKPNSIKSFLVRHIYKSADHILAASLESKKDLVLAGVTADNITPYKQWFCAPSDDIKIKTPLKLKNNQSFKVLFVGRILRMKGIFHLCEAAKKLGKEFSIIIIGDGDDLSELRDKYNTVENIYILGKKNYAELKSFYSLCDCVILPTQSEESLPMVVVESLSMGKPIILTKYGGAKEMVNDKVSLIIDPSIDNIEKAIKRMRELINEQTRKICINYAKEMFGEKNAENYLHILLG